jgi:hypothetical protein
MMEIASANESVNFASQLLFQLVAITLRETTGDDDLLAALTI